MNPRHLLSISSSLLLLPLSIAAHGGVYRPPPTPEGPPNGGSSGPGANGGAKGPRPTAPMAPGPTTSGPGIPGVSGGGVPKGPTTLLGGGMEPDLSVWNAWWDLNKASYLELKAHVHAPGLATGADAGFLGDPESARGASRRPTEKQVREQVVPALLKVLAAEKDNDLVSGALIALAKIG